MKWAPVFLLLAGCFSARYLVQATAGQIDLLARARPLSSAMRDPKTPPQVTRVLGWVPEVKAFGEAHGLTPTKNYSRYSDLHRDAAVWVARSPASKDAPSARN